jgi:hypothetical protein
VVNYCKVCPRFCQDWGQPHSPVWLFPRTRSDCRTFTIPSTLKTIHLWFLLRLYVRVLVNTELGKEWKQLWTNLRYCSGIYIEECRKCMKVSQSVVMAKLWVGHLLNTGQKYYCLSMLSFVCLRSTEKSWEMLVMLFSSRTAIILVLILCTSTAGFTLNCRSSVI